MKSFHQLSYHERDKIYIGLCEGKTIRAIARELARAASTISREIRRNSDHIGYLYPGKAHELAIKRKKKNRCKLNKDEKLKTYVVEKLHKKMSPKVISGQYRLENPEKTISKEAIYQWIYSKEGENLGLKRLLVRLHKKRGLKRKCKKTLIKNKISIHARPEIINQRLEPGHWECDLIFNQGSQSLNICTMIDRFTRQAILIQNKSKNSINVIEAIISYLRKYNLLCKSITFDNGTEFTCHDKLNELNIDTYFCDAGCPWQKGSIENLNGILRRFLPFNMPAESITQEFVQAVNDQVNNMPRAILGFKTPLEYSKEMESRMKTALPAVKAKIDIQKSLGVAFHP